VRIDMQRMLVQTEQTEQQIVRLGNRSARPMPYDVSDFEILEHSSVGGMYFRHASFPSLLAITVASYSSRPFRPD
jgi:hypothetical protein